MRYAILSDIHANLEALTATLAAIDAEHVDAVVALGDIVGYHANPNECIDLLRARGVRSIAGNHDRAAAGLDEPTAFGEEARRAIQWTRGQLTRESRAYLSELPMTEVVGGRFLLFHGALHPEPGVTLHLSSMARVEHTFAALCRGWAVPLAFFGHTHRAVAYRGDAHASPRAVAGPRVALEPGSTYLVNPGSVGQPRDGDDRAAYAILDENARTIDLLRVVYDVAGCRAKAARAGLLYREGPIRRGTLKVGDWIDTAVGAIQRRLP